jgi:hypothetical protein
MPVRWYTGVVDSHDVRSQAAWWAQVLDWREVYAADDEVVIVPPHAIDESRSIPVLERGPGLVFVTVPEDKQVKNRLHLDLAPMAGEDHEAAVADPRPRRDPGRRGPGRRAVGRARRPGGQRVLRPHPARLSGGPPARRRGSDRPRHDGRSLRWVVLALRLVPRRWSQTSADGSAAARAARSPSTSRSGP